jgi:nucleotide-binding universal stress UspA family protein
VATFRTIVVGVDFSEYARVACTTAVSLAADIGAAVIVVHVVSQSALRVAIQEGLFQSGDDDDVIRAKVKAYVEQQFDAFFDAIRVDATEVERVVLRGDPARNLVEFIEEREGDLIVVGRRGKTLADVLLGSVAERVVRQAPCPVLLVKQ